MKAPASRSTFESYSRNAEDVLLWRSLAGVRNGRYLDVGARHPVVDSVSMAFYQIGWQGITVSADDSYAVAQRELRPRDIHIASTDERAQLQERPINHILKEARWRGTDIHFMSVDTEGYERETLESTDLSIWRPWIIVVASGDPDAEDATPRPWKAVLDEAHYRFCFFDGMSRFFLAQEHQELARQLSYPACALDNYTSLAYRDASKRAALVPALIEDVARWKAESVERWAISMAEADSLRQLESDIRSLQQHNEALRFENETLRRQIDTLQRAIAQLHASTSWRVTRPLRALGGLLASRRLPR